MGEVAIRYTDIQARIGETLKQARPEPNGWQGEPERKEGITVKGKALRMSWGVLSGIVLRAWESHVHGEGPDRSTQSAKETYAEHCRVGTT